MILKAIFLISAIFVVTGSAIIHLSMMKKSISDPTINRIGKSSKIVSEKLLNLSILAIVIGIVLGFSGFVYMLFNVSSYR